MTEALVLITDAYIACTVPNVLCNCLILDPPLVNIYLMSLKTFERKSYCIFDVISLTIRLIVAYVSSLAFEPGDAFLFFA